MFQPTMNNIFANIKWLSLVKGEASNRITALNQILKANIPFCDKREVDFHKLSLKQSLNSPN